MTERKIIGNTAGRDIEEVTVTNDKGLSFSAMTYGATITKLIVPDKNGKGTDIAVGFETLDGYVKNSDNQGAAIGRFCNRIGKARFSLDGTEYKLSANVGKNILHGNDEFRTAVWDIVSLDESSVKFTYTSPDGTNGFPGTLRTEVLYTLQEDSLKIDYYSVSDKKTVINLTNHLYFNLTGDSEQTIDNHLLRIDADCFTDADDELIVTGEILPVDGTPMDFREEKRIGRDFDSDYPAVKMYGGYDSNFCLNNYNGALRYAATLCEEGTGIQMDVFTDLPGMQVYTGNVLKPFAGKYSKNFTHHGAVCLETQFFPDAPNKENFKQCTYDAGQPFISTTIYKFSVRK